MTAGKSHGAKAVKWVEAKLIHGEGDLFGKPYRLLPWHKRFLFEWAREDSTGRNPWWYNESLVGAESGASKTEFFAALALLEMAGPPPFRRVSPIVTMAAASFEQAGELFRQAQIMAGGTEDMPVENAPLYGYFDVFDKVIRYSDGRPGRIQRTAAKASTAEGGKESLLLGDELHEWQGNLGRVWTVRAKSLTKRRLNPGRACGMSTAGRGKGSMPPKDSDSLLWRLYARGLLEAEDPTSRLLFDWVQPPESIITQRDNPEAIYAALRNMRAPDATWSVEDRAQEILRRKIPWVEALRYYFNMFVTLDIASWLADIPGVWEEGHNLEAEPEDGDEVVVGVDMALHSDSVGLVVAGLKPDGAVGWAHRHFPPVNGRIDHVEVFRWIADVAAERWTIKAVTYDPRFFELPARQLEDEGFAVVEFKQTQDRLVAADNFLFELVKAGKLLHLPDPTLDSHAGNASWRESEQGRYLSKGRSLGHMDLIRAGSMATYELMMQEPDFGTWAEAIMPGGS